MVLYFHFLFDGNSCLDIAHSAIVNISSFSAQYVQEPQVNAKKKKSINREEHWHEYILTLITNFCNNMFWVSAALHGNTYWITAPV